MKRLHVHIAVDDLDRNIAFYASMFGAEPTVRHGDYAKWQLDDPRVNFAISSRGRKAGLDHLGIQVETDEELAGMHERLAAADIATVDQAATACCYARSDKHWAVDPQGIAWETFRTLASIPMFGESAEVAGATASAAACCAPPVTAAPVAIAAKAATPVASCCPPAPAGAGGCC